MQLNRQISEADYEKAVVTFRQTLYRALSEVENALSARIQFEAEEEFLKKSLYAATEVEKITEIRYRAGAIPLRLLLDAQQTRREVEAAVSSNTLNRLTNRVNIYIAFGGDTSDRNNPADSHHRTPDFRPDSDAFTFPGMQNAKRPDFQPPESESPSTGK
jgi:outer membrane protein TolC